MWGSRYPSEDRAHEPFDTRGRLANRETEMTDRPLCRGPNWEVYRVNAGSVEDPSEYESDVFKPIR